MDQTLLPPPEPVAEGIVVHRDVMVPMRDGVRLATDIYRPADDGGPVAALPAILERTAYGKGARSRSEVEVGMAQPMTRAEVASHFVRHDYAVVYQDCRGRYGSEGEFTKYLSEGSGWIRHAGVASPSRTGQRRGRHDGPLLCGPHADGAGLPRPAGAGLHGARIPAASPTPIAAASARVAPSS